MTKQFTLSEALYSLHPTSPFRIFDNDYQKIDWLDENTPLPTEQELLDEVARLQLEYESKEYQRQRAVNYPEIGNQLDMLWHAIDSGTLNKTSDFYTAIKAVKDTYPKSE